MSNSSSMGNVAVSAVQWDTGPRLRFPAAGVPGGGITGSMDNGALSAAQSDTEPSSTSAGNPKGYGAAKQAQWGTGPRLSS